MNKREFMLLEKAFIADMNGGTRIFQTRSKLVEKLIDDGYIEKKSVTISGNPPVKVEGYRLTLLGNAAYCANF